MKEVNKQNKNLSEMFDKKLDKNLDKYFNEKANNSTDLIKVDKHENENLL